MSGRAAETAVERFVVAEVADLPPGSRALVEVAGRSIGVFNVHGRYFAIRNRCPHQGAPLALGTTIGLATPCFRGDAPPGIEVERDGEIVKCPWHGWEFDLATGEAVFGEGVRVAVYRAYLERGVEGAPTIDVPPSVETYRTSVEQGLVVVEVRVDARAAQASRAGGASSEPSGSK